MKWKGKLVGLLLGALTRRPAFMLLGLVVGHLFDIGLLGTMARGSGSSAADGEGSAHAPVGSTPPLDPYAVLGAERGASDDEVETAWRRAMSEYHPDRVATAGKEIRDLAGQRALEINAAYETIKRERRR